MSATASCFHAHSVELGFLLGHLSYSLRRRRPIIFLKKDSFSLTQAFNSFTVALIFILVLIVVVVLEFYSILISLFVFLYVCVVYMFTSEIKIFKHIILYYLSFSASSVGVFLNASAVICRSER